MIARNLVKRAYPDKEPSIQSLRDLLLPGIPAGFDIQIDYQDRNSLEVSDIRGGGGCKVSGKITLDTPTEEIRSLFISLRKNGEQHDSIGNG